MPMNELNINTLILTIRSFSNEVTVNWLADELGISYSTLARCKNGQWPRSITIVAMENVLETCRVSFFDGEGDRLAKAVICALDERSIDTRALRRHLRERGYDSFLHALISTAQGRRVDAEPCEEPRDGREQPMRRNLWMSSIVVSLPISVVLAIGLLNMPLSDMFLWATRHVALTCMLLVLLAILPTACGILVDAPLAWRAYMRKNPDTEFSLRTYALVSKYGSPNAVIEGAGRFDLGFRHCVYQTMCNVLGALCTISLFVCLASQPGFLSFFTSHEWIEFFKVGVVVGFYVAFSHSCEVSSQKPCTAIGETENPDVFLPTRVHVWANAAHLVVTFSLVCILVLGLLSFSFVMMRSYTAPLLLLWPYAQTVAFLAYSSISPYARSIRALGAGSFLPGIIASSIGLPFVVCICYLPSPTTAIICFVCGLCLVSLLVWCHIQNIPVSFRDHAQIRKSRSYSIVVVAALCVMLALGFATSTLV